MTPYYQRDNVTLFYGDACEVVHDFQGRTVVTDPPYNVGYHYEGGGDNLAPECYHNLLQQTLRVPSVVLHYPENLFELSWLLEEIPSKVVAWVYNANTPRQWRAIAWYGTQAPDFSRGGSPTKTSPTGAYRRFWRKGNKRVFTIGGRCSK